MSEDDASGSDQSAFSSPRNHDHPTADVEDLMEAGHQQSQEMPSTVLPGSREDDLDEAEKSQEMPSTLLPGSREDDLDEAEKKHEEIQAKIQSKHDEIQQDIKERGIKAIRSFIFFSDRSVAALFERVTDRPHRYTVCSYSLGRPGGRICWRNGVNISRMKCTMVTRSLVLVSKLSSSMHA